MTAKYTTEEKYCGYKYEKKILLVFSVTEKHYFKSANILTANSSRIYLSMRRTTWLKNFAG